MKLREMKKKKQNRENEKEKEKEKEKENKKNLEHYLCSVETQTPRAEFD